MLSKVAYQMVGRLYNHRNVNIYFLAKFGSVTDALKKLLFLLSREWDTNMRTSLRPKN